MFLEMNGLGMFIDFDFIKFNIVVKIIDKI